MGISWVLTCLSFVSSLQINILGNHTSVMVQAVQFNFSNYETIPPLSRHLLNYLAENLNTSIKQG